MKTIVVGLGNPILGDDGVGWKVVDQIRRCLTSPPAPLLAGEGSQVDIEYLSLGGISLMERLIGYDRAILIDAFAVNESMGSISIMDLDQLPDYSAFHITSAHDTSLQNAIELGRSLGAQLPNEVTIVGIATRHIHDFSDELSPPVAHIVPRAVRIALGLLKEEINVE